MRVGSLIDYTICPFGFEIRWTTLITSYEPPFRFTDVQIRGPYSFWHHVHTFSESDKGTLMTDEVTYAIPFGVLGKWIHHVRIKNELENIFNYREKVIQSHFKEA